MPRANSNGITLEYDTFGSADDAPLLLIMGLGAQMTLWEEDFCEGLAQRGHHVIRFDNRDIGLSTHLDDAGAPNIIEIMQQVAAGSAVDAPYSLPDMANDTAGLLDALGIDRAHLVGASMGGMIAQATALAHPSRVRSLTSIMSTTGDPSVPPAKEEAMQALMTPAPQDREGNIERSVTTSKIIGSPGFPFDEKAVRERAGRQYDRAFHPAGMQRQMAAILSSGSRAEALRELDTPTLVIHGDADPLVSVEGGRHTAACIKGAELLLIEGMGHDLPRGAWPQIFDGITTLTRAS